MKKIIIILFSTALVFSACSILQTITNVSRLKFKLDSVNSFRVNGISINNKSKLSDFNTFDVLKLSSALASGELPVSFNVNIAAANPNDGTGGYPATDLKLKSFPWELYLNGKKTISGNIDEPLVVPGIGEQKIISLKIEMDLLEFFENRGVEEAVNLALKLGGKQGSTTNVQVIASPVLETSFGDLAYPEPVKIVDHTFR